MHFEDVKMWQYRFCYQLIFNNTRFECKEERESVLKVKAVIITGREVDRINLKKN